MILCALIVALVVGAAQAQTATQLTPASSVGLGPEGIATDGTNVFVANQFSDTVTKLRASDGSVVGTFSVGHRPVAVAFDGAFFWVANYLSNNVMKVDASGVVVATYATGDGPGG
jgi:YVTN family beta-propeller protein